MVEQAKAASDQLLNAERMKASAAQEAAYYRAKLAAIESSSSSDVQRLDRQRIAELERELASLAGDRWVQDKQFQELKDSLALQTTLCEQAESRAADATKRADALEDSHERAVRSHADVQQHKIVLEAQLRDQADRLLTSTSGFGQSQAELASLQNQIEDLTLSRDQHIRVLDQTRVAMQAAHIRAEEIDSQYQRATERIAMLEGDIAEYRGDLESKSHELDTVKQRLADVENSWAKSREEADALRAATTGSLGQLLDSHRDIKSDEERVARVHEEKMEALVTEAASLRAMLKDASQRLEETDKQLLDERRRVNDTHTETAHLRAQVIGLRGQLSSEVSNAGRLRLELASKESQLREKIKETSNYSIKLTMLRNYASENGVDVDEDAMRSTSISRNASAVTSELESKLSERTRLHEAAERELSQALRRQQDAETQMSSLSQQLARARSPISRESPDLEARAVEAERKLEETEKSYKNRMAQMEEDYQLAVHYVKYVAYFSDTIYILILVQRD